jgi:hypothetical protein
MYHISRPLQSNFLFVFYRIQKNGLFFSTIMPLLKSANINPYRVSLIISRNGKVTKQRRIGLSFIHKRLNAFAFSPLFPILPLRFLQTFPRLVFVRLLHRLLCSPISFSLSANHSKFCLQKDQLLHYLQLYSFLLPLQEVPQR